LAAMGVAGVLILWHSNPADWNLSICSFHRLTGLNCPGCGATRATHELLHGRVFSALQHNALWILSLPLVVYVGIAELWRTRHPGSRSVGFWRNRWFLAAMLVVVLAFFILRNVPIHPLELLSPPG
jgi:hypothetical protein